MYQATAPSPVSFEEFMMHSSAFPALAVLLQREIVVIPTRVSFTAVVAGPAVAGYAVGKLVKFATPAGTPAGYRVAAGAVTGMAVGAAIGSVVPGIGTAAGAAIGFVCGAIGAWFA